LRLALWLFGGNLNVGDRWRLWPDFLILPFLRPASTLTESLLIFVPFGTIFAEVLYANSLARDEVSREQ